MAFDINDRATWAWIDDAVAESRANNEYLLNPQDKTSFYQFSNGVPYKHYCSIIDEKGTRQVFNPPVNTCDWPQNITEAVIYQWAVGHGLVKDQR